MSMKNKIKAFIDSNPELTIYGFRQKTGIANKTAYDLYHNPGQYPSREVMNKICKAFNIQPGDLLEWVPEEEVADRLCSSPVR